MLDVADVLILYELNGLKHMHKRSLTFTLTQFVLSLAIPKQGEHLAVYYNYHVIQSVNLTSLYLFYNFFKKYFLLLAKA